MVVAGWLGAWLLAAEPGSVAESTPTAPVQADTTLTRGAAALASALEDAEMSRVRVVFADGSSMEGTYVRIDQEEETLILMGDDLEDSELSLAQVHQVVILATPPAGPVAKSSPSPRVRNSPGDRKARALEIELTPELRDQRMVNRTLIITGGVVMSTGGIMMTVGAVSSFLEGFAYIFDDPPERPRGRPYVIGGAILVGTGLITLSVGVVRQKRLARPVRDVSVSGWGGETGGGLTLRGRF